MRFFRSLALLLLILALTACTPPPSTAPTEPPPSPAPSASPTIEQGHFSADAVTLSYLLYLPATVTPDTPMLVYLHGGSGKGEEPNALLALNGFPKFLSEGKLGTPEALILIPQLPRQYTGWESVGDALIALIQQLTAEHTPQANHIALTGHSMGGTGVWRLAIAFPETFARIAPLSGSVRLTDSNINALAQMPIRTFVGEADTVVDPQSTINFINALKKQNANASLTVLKNATHESVPATVYLDKDLALLNWLLGAS